MKPILFNAEMVRAILEDRKTVTRRVVKPRSPKACGFYVTHRKSDGAFMGVYDYDEHERMFDSPQAQPAYPGDILYVRETWAEVETVYGVPYYIYKADDQILHHSSGENFERWRPSIHMHREAARIFLRVTDVRVERLRDITLDDGYKEGVDCPTQFDKLWNSTIKPADFALYGWDANPWVWVIEFERISREEAKP